MSEGGWTFETLLKHLVALIDANDKRYEQRFGDSKIAVDAALSAAKEAVVKAETASEKRFEGVNEFRAALGDQQRTLMPRIEAEVRMNVLDQKIAALEKTATASVGRQAGASNLWGWIAGVVGIALALISLLLRIGGGG